MMWHAEDDPDGPRLSLGEKLSTVPISVSDLAAFSLEKNPPKIGPNTDQNTLQNGNSVQEKNVAFTFSVLPTFRVFCSPLKLVNGCASCEFESSSSSKGLF